MHITQASKAQAGDIARLITMAMTDDCCQYLAGPDHTVDDFRRLITLLAEDDDTQYSWRHTLVALDDEGRVAGICVAYPGADLHRLRRAFIDGARRLLGQDHSHMADETGPGELYIDSLAVYPEYRGQGIASLLLSATVERAHAAGLPAGLLVDKGNPRAARLYASLGFKAVGEATWGGHPMTHMRY